MDTKNDWISILVDAALSKARTIVEGDIGQGRRFPPIDSIIAGGIIIRGISLLDDALEEYIENNNINIPVRRPKLYDRLLKLNKLGKLDNYSDIDSWRNRRNDVGHEVNTTFTWDEADQCVASIFRELNNIGILDNYPQLNVKKVNQRIPPDQTEHNIEIKVTVTVHEGDTVYREYESRIIAG
ncbi:MAG: hypothetical protein ABW116_11800 [Candidatus Sedimenticola sp. 20ELBAFRAG]